MLFDTFALERKSGVPQPPKMRKTFGVRRRRKTDLSEKIARFIIKSNELILKIYIRGQPPDWRKERLPIGSKGVPL